MIKNIEDLAKLYAPYKIYTKKCYSNNTPVRVFQNEYSQDHYSKDINKFLEKQDNGRIRIGADLPWWGRYYFSRKKGFRTMIIGQDSLSKDAGSVVLFSHLLPQIDKKNEYEEYTKLIGGKFNFRFKSYEKIRKYFIEWNNIDFIFVTDALKVYQEYSSDKLDRKKSRKLLKKEIEGCNPNLLILLGSRPYYLLKKYHNGQESLTNLLEKNKEIDILERKAIVTPFPIGRGRCQKNFEKHMLKATSLIKKFRDD